MSGTRQNRRELKCRRCNQQLQPGHGDFYVVTILAIADPAPPVFTGNDLTRDTQQEIQNLLAQLRNVDDEQAQEQVYRRVLFHLCQTCYADWIIDPTSNRANPGQDSY
jgi:hypothetical protein